MLICQAPSGRRLLSIISRIGWLDGRDGMDGWLKAASWQAVVWVPRGSALPGIRLLEQASQSMNSTINAQRLCMRLVVMGSPVASFGRPFCRVTVQRRAFVPYSVVWSRGGLLVLRIHVTRRAMLMRRPSRWTLVLPR